jgi:hypothetical protein
VTNGSEEERPRGEEPDLGRPESQAPGPEASPAGPEAEPEPPDAELRSGAPLGAATEAVLAAGAGIARGSVAATRGGAALVDRVSRVTYWPAQLCVLGAILLQVRLPGKLIVGPSWLLPSLEGALLIGLAATTPMGRVDQDHHLRRRVAIGLIALVNAANAVSLYLLAHELLHIGKLKVTGTSLILSGIAIWLTNLLIFALWYWQLDRGGPANRLRHPDPTTPEGHPDFIFPEMDGGRPYTPASWTPGFLDYVSIAATTATAFSPTDTMPNSQRAKVLMNVQGLISLVTLGLIISRAVGILGASGS